MTPNKTSTTTSSKLRVERFSHWLELLNLKFAPNSEARYESKAEKSNLLPLHFASVHGSQGLWNLSSTINSDWWELWEHPTEDKIYAILWIRPYTGVVLDQCQKNIEKLTIMLSRLDDMASLFRKASLRMVSPEECDSIKIPTASASTKRSLKHLSNEAKFIKKNISGMEILDCVIRTRSLIDRAARVHKDTIPQIFSAAKRTTEASEQKDGQEKSGISEAPKNIPLGKPKVRAMPQSGNRHSPQSKKRKASA